MTENFPKWKKETDTQIQEAQKVPNKMKPNEYDNIQNPETENPAT